MTSVKKRLDQSTLDSTKIDNAARRETDIVSEPGMYEVTKPSPLAGEPAIEIDPEGTALGAPLNEGIPRLSAAYVWSDDVDGVACREGRRWVLTYAHEGGLAMHNTGIPANRPHGVEQHDAIEAAREHLRARNARPGTR